MSYCASRPSLFPCAFTIVDGEGKILFAGMSHGVGASFNPYKLPGRTALAPGIKIRIYRCASVQDAGLKRDLLKATHEPTLNRPHGRPKGSRDSRSRYDLRAERLFISPEQVARKDDPDWKPEAMGRISNSDDERTHLTESQQKYAHDPEFMEDYYTPDWDKMKEETASQRSRGSLSHDHCAICDKILRSDCAACPFKPAAR